MRGYLVSLSATPHCPLSRAVPLSAQTVWHLSFKWATTPLTLVMPLSFSASIVPGSEIQPRHSECCNSVISTNSILACTADEQPNTEAMNKSQYSTHSWQQKGANLCGVLLVRRFTTLILCRPPCWTYCTQLSTYNKKVLNKTLAYLNISFEMWKRKSRKRLEWFESMLLTFKNQESQITATILTNLAAFLFLKKNSIQFCQAEIFFHMLLTFLSTNKGWNSDVGSVHNSKKYTMYQERTIGTIIPYSCNPFFVFVLWNYLPPLPFFFFFSNSCEQNKWTFKVVFFFLFFLTWRLNYMISTQKVQFVFFYVSIFPWWNLQFPVNGKMNLSH